MRLQTAVVFMVSVVVTALVVFGAKAALLAGAAAPDSVAALGGVAPSQVVEIFNANAIVIMFVAGMLLKYLPWAAKIPNVVIPWVNAIGYMLYEAFTGGGGGAMASAGGVTAAGFTIGGLFGVVNLLAPAIGHALGASWWWDKFVKPVVSIVATADAARKGGATR